MDNEYTRMYTAFVRVYFEQGVTNTANMWSLMQIIRIWKGTGATLGLSVVEKVCPNTSCAVFHLWEFFNDLIEQLADKQPARLWNSASTGNTALLAGQSYLLHQPVMPTWAFL